MPEAGLEGSHRIRFFDGFMNCYIKQSRNKLFDINIILIYIIHHYKISQKVS